VNGSPKNLNSLINLTKNSSINIHGWIWTFNRPNDEIAMKNPGWYSVNKNGKNSYDMRPYVDYYQWLSPFSRGAVNHIKNNIQGIANVEGIASIHLDYVRYCDVFLPSTLQIKYGINQKLILPEYDFGYHKNARSTFFKVYGCDPINIQDEDLYDLWTKFRHNAITKVVKDLKIIANNSGTSLSAAVFPTPEMSKTMVLQDWGNWELDIVSPMNYQHFYDEDTDWIAKNVEVGVKKVGSNCKYLCGLFADSLDLLNFEKAINVSLEKNADGINFFSASGLTDEKLNIIKTFN
jgi:uncharacterized lipoprotein YddW (UPF0748 family)